MSPVLTTTTQGTVVKGGSWVSSVTPGAMAVSIRVPAEVFLQLSIRGRGGCESRWETGPSQAKVCCPGVQAQFWESPYSLWLVWCFSRPVLARDTLAGLVDRASVLLPRAIVAVWWKVGTRHHHARPHSLSPGVSSLGLVPYPTPASLTLGPNFFGAAGDLVAESHTHTRPCCEAPGGL